MIDLDKSPLEWVWSNDDSGMPRVAVRTLSFEEVTPEEYGCEELEEPFTVDVCWLMEVYNVNISAPKAKKRFEKVMERDAIFKLQRLDNELSKSEDEFSHVACQNYPMCEDDDYSRQDANCGKIHDDSAFYEYISYGFPT
jgi:hypothetical protein